MDGPLTGVSIDFSEDSLTLLNFSIAFIMFGVAMSINRKEFQEIGRNPKSVITGGRESISAPSGGYFSACMASKAS